LSPAAQVAAVVVVGLLGLAWVWTRRPQSGPGIEPFNLGIASMNEQTKVTAHLAENVERIIEQNAVIIPRLPGSMQAG
jgi:hypothetical protein